MLRVSTFTALLQLACVLCACLCLVLRRVTWLTPSAHVRDGGNGGARQVELVIAIATPQLASMLAVLQLLALLAAVFAAPDNLHFSRISPAYRARLVKTGSRFESWCLKHAPQPPSVTHSGFELLKSWLRF